MNKRALLTIVTCILFSLASRSQNVTYILTDGISEGNLKTKIERNISMLLTAINTAYNQESSEINYSSVDITYNATNAIGTLWQQFHFKTEKSKYVSFCVKLSGTTTIYHQSNIGVYVDPVDGTNYTGEPRREISIYLDKNGTIVDFSFTKGKFEYENVLKKGEELKDIDKRLQIIKWCEYLQNAYCNKDIHFIDDVFSDDALILVGKVITRRVSENDRIAIKKESMYKEYSKKEYLGNLKKAFGRNGYVNVSFEDFEVVRHWSNPNFYGVTLKQVWRSSTYSDTGILFLIWDFTNEDKPKIHVRVWQHMEQKRFEMGDFDIPDK